MRLDRAMDGYWLARRRKLAAATQADYEITFRRLREFVGPEREMATIEAADIDGLLNELAGRGLAAKSLANAHTALSSLWTWAGPALGVAHVVRQVERPAWRRPLIEPFSQEELAGMLRACDSMEPYDRRWRRNVSAQRATALRDRAILLTLVDTGIRASELTGLALQDYDERKGRLHIRHGKGDKARMVFLGDTARMAVWRYLGTREGAGKEGPLFATRTGQAMDRAGLLHLVQRIGQRAGVAKTHPHRFRHTFAIWFLRNGGNPLELQRILGHEKLETVLIYVRLAEVDIERAAKAASPVDGWRLK